MTDLRKITVTNFLELKEIHLTQREYDVFMWISSTTSPEQRTAKAMGRHFNSSREYMRQVLTSLEAKKYIAIKKGFGNTHYWFPLVTVEEDV